MAFLNVLRFVLLSALFFTSTNAACKSPRVRKEWRSISSAERTAWIKAVNCLARLPHDSKIAPTVNRSVSLIPEMTSDSSYFDDFTYTHMDLNVLIHGTGYFLPWHRIFVQTFEDKLRKRCGYTGVQPYWDWTQDAADFYHATIFSNSTKEGLGSWGNPENDYQISTGGFKDITVAYPVPHHIRRNYTLQPVPVPGFPQTIAPPPFLNTTFSKQNVDYTINSFTGDYINFQAYLENIDGPHPGAHILLGGDMLGTCPFGLGIPNCYAGMKWSPNDPMFFLHHTMIDKIWYEWQLRDSSNKNAFGGGTISVQVDPTQAVAYPTGAPPFLNLSSVIPGDGFWKDVKIEDVMDTVGGKLCYIYA